MSFEIQFARITNSGKLDDRFLTCQHLESPDLAKSSMGEVFSLIEILSPWFPTAQIGKLIISNFTKYYYSGGSTSDLVNFEDSLKKINEDLAQVTQEGETDWIGNLNGILASIVGNNMHLAPTGHIEAYIFRDGKINHLTYALSDTTQNHPLKTFSNVVSGELKNHDKILFTNKDLFSHISLESVRQIISLNNPFLAATQITKLLRKDRARNVNLIIVNLTDKEELSTEALEQKESIFYLDKSTESLVGKLANFGKSLFSPISRFTKDKFKNIKSKKISRSPLVPRKEVPKPTLENDRFQKEFISDEGRDDSLLKDEEIKYSPDLYVHYYNAEKKKTDQAGKKVAFAKSFLQILSRIASWIFLKLKQFFNFISMTARDRNRRKYLFIAFAVILIIIVGLVITFRGRGSKIGSLQSQKILDEAIAASKEGKDLLSSGNKESAIEKFVISIDKANSIANNAIVASDAKNVISSTYQELDKITSTTRFAELKPQVSINETGKELFIIGGEAYIICDENIYKTSLLGGTPSKIASLPKGSFVGGAKQDKIIYLYSSDQNVYSFDTSTNKIEAAKINEGRWETANSINFYVGGLYLLDGVLGQIYKHTSSQDSFAKGEEYISTTTVNLKDAVSFAIDGSIYVLKNNGKVIKLQKSKVQDFSLKNIPKPFDAIKEPSKIFTDSDTPSLYILDKAQKRILEFDENGQFVHQYALPENFNKISDFSVSIKSRKIWILEQGSVYEISI